jgi:hypothetical protein
MITTPGMCYKAAMRFVFLLAVSVWLICSPPARAELWSEPLPGFYSPESGDRECRAQWGAGWRLPEADELDAAIRLGLVPGLNLRPNPVPGFGPEIHRYLWSASLWSPNGHRGWGKLLRLEDGVWVREARSYAHTVVCVRD